VEYKRHSNENVINQGLFYLDWLLDHQAEFRWLVMEKIGKDAAEDIEWDGTRLICIATDFNRYDEHAVQQINRNIELMRYRYFGDDLLLLELVNAQTAQQANATKSVAAQKPDTQAAPNKTGNIQRTRLLKTTPELLSLYNDACNYIDQLGDEVQRKDLLQYTAFKRIKNFACIVILPGKDPKLQITLKLPGELGEENAFSRNVSNIGSWGTGDLEVNVRTPEDWEKARPLVERAYQES
jgi:predicted transport protein